MTVLRGKASAGPCIGWVFPTTTTRTTSVRTQPASLHRSTPCPRKRRRFYFSPPFCAAERAKCAIAITRYWSALMRRRAADDPLLRLIKERCTQGNNKSPAMPISIPRRYDTSICHTFIRRLLCAIYQSFDLARHVRGLRLLI